MAESTPTVHGTCDERFLAVKQKLQEYLTAGRELGASICVNINGTNVVDLWGGYANESKTKAWEENTITNIWSTTKNVTNLAALLLIDRGLLDPEEKVSKYWPEFATNGKENVLVRHLMTHSSGLSGWEEKITVEDLYDLEKTTKLLEQQAPWWTPGTQSGYHSLTMGHPIAHLIKLLTGKSLRAFIASELALPLNADYQLGAAESDWHRAADVIPPPPMDFSAAFSDDFANPSSVPFKTFTNPFLDAAVANTPGWRGAQIGAGNGFSNARGIVRILSPISLGGTVDGKTYLSQPTLDKVFTTHLHSKDLVIAKKVRFGLGFGIASETEQSEFPAWMPRGKIASWGGWGGSLAVMDAGRGVTVGYVMNRMENTPTDGGVERGGEYVGLVYKALGVEV